MNDKSLTDLPGASGDDSQASGSTQDLRTPSPDRAASRDFSGTTLAGYRLVRKIAEGGMGVVYEAIQLNLDRKVALKILSEELALRPEFLSRFQREAKAAGSLNHPNVVQVHDFGEAQGWHYLIMEYVDGQDLSEYAEQHGKSSITMALDVIEQAALALQAACEKSIIHRDIKPSNLMLTRDGRVKVSDLGLAKILTETSDLTVSGVGMGSPYFMAPEQASDARGVDHRADIYALGLTLLYMLTGQRPFEGSTPFSIVMAHANQPLPTGLDLGTELPPEVEGLIQRMSAKNPDERYLNYDLLIADLHRVKAGYTPAFEPLTNKRNYFSRNVILIAALVLFVITLAAVLIVSRSHNASVVAKDKTEAPVELAREREPFQQPPRPGEGPDRFAGGPPDGPRGMPPGPEGNFGDPRGPTAAGGAERFPSPLPRLGRPTPNPLADGPIETMLKQADDYATGNPQNFRDIIDRYRQIQAKARGTPRGREIEDKLNRTVEQHRVASREAIREYEIKMNEKVAAGKLQEAYDLWRAFPSNLRTRESDQQIQDMLQKTLPPSFVPK